MITHLIHQHSDRLTQVGLHFLWQGTAIALLAALINHFLFKSPRHRATVHLLGLLALSLCGSATWIMLKETPPVIVSQPAITQPIPQEAIQPITIQPATPVAPVKAPLPPSVWIVGIYLIGLALMLLRVIRGYRWSHRIRKHGKPITESLWTQSLTHALATMKLRAKPVMIWSEKVTSPVVTGILRPMIILPVSLMSGLPPAQATAILSHELAHLRRFDHLVVVGQRLLEALFFFHPAVWFLSHRLDQEREKACDDLVVKAGHQRADYAEALVKIASETQPTLALAAAKNAHLKERIFRILHHPQPTTVRVNRGGWLVIATSIAALVFTSLSPAQNQVKEADEPKEIEAATNLEKIEIKIPEVHFNNATLQEAVEFLRHKSIELDPDKKGLNFVVRQGDQNEKTHHRAIDNLDGRNFTIQQVLEAICLKTNTKFQVDDFAITIMPLKKGEVAGVVDPSQLIQRKWTTPPNFFKLLAPDHQGPRKSTVAHLTDQGVTFAKGAAASWLRKSNTLIVRNTPANLELIDAIVESFMDPAEAEKAKALAAEERQAVKEVMEIVFPEVFLENATFEEAVDFLRVRSLELDPKKQGLNFNIFRGGEEEEDTLIKRLDLKNVPLRVVLDYVSHAAKFRWKIEGRNVSLMPISQEVETAAERKEIFQRSWRTPQNFLQALAGEGVPPKSKSITGHLKTHGVTFPDGTSASYLKASQTLIVRNTSGNLALIGAIMTAIVDPAKANEEAAKPINPGALRIVQKLQIKIPEIRFNKATIEEAIEFLRLRSIDLDPEPDRHKKGINFVVRRKLADIKKPAVVIDNLEGRDFTFMEALGAICMKTGYQYKVDEFAITLIPLTEEGKAGRANLTGMVQRRWKASEKFVDFITPKAAKAKPVLMQPLMEALGVEFPPGSSLHYSEEEQNLVVTNFPVNLELIDAILVAAGEKEKGKVNPLIAPDPIFNQLIIPEIILQNSTLEEAVHFLRLRSRELDPGKQKHGMNINIFSADVDLSRSIIKNLHLTNAPLRVVIQYLCDATKTRYRIEGRNLSIIPMEGVPGPSAIQPLRESKEEIAERAAQKKKALAAKLAWEQKIKAIEKIIIPNIQLNNSTLAEAVAFLKIQSLENDPDKKGVTIKLEGGDNFNQSQVKNLHLINVPLIVVLQYVCEASNSRFTIEGRNISIFPIKE